MFKMVNTREKGMKSERRAVKELENDGWLVYRVKGSTIFNRNVDMFGLFDILALKGLKKRWIQIKTNRKPVVQEFWDFHRKYCDIPNETVEIWVWYDRKGFEKFDAWDNRWSKIKYE